MGQEAKVSRNYLAGWVGLSPHSSNDLNNYYQSDVALIIRSTNGRYKTYQSNPNLIDAFLQSRMDIEMEVWSPTNFSSSPRSASASSPSAPPKGSYTTGRQLYSSHLPSHSAPRKQPLITGQQLYSSYLSSQCKNYGNEPEQQIAFPDNNRSGSSGNAQHALSRSSSTLAESYPLPRSRDGGTYFNNSSSPLSVLASAVAFLLDTNGCSQTFDHTAPVDDNIEDHRMEDVSCEVQPIHDAEQTAEQEDEVREHGSARSVSTPLSRRGRRRRGSVSILPSWRGRLRKRAAVSTK